MAASGRLFNRFRKKGYDGSNLNLLTSTVKAIWLKSSYVPDFDAHEFVSDLTPASNEQVAAGCARKTLANKTLAVVAGQDKCKFSSDPVQQVAAGGPIVARYIALVVDTGNDATSPLIGLITPDSTPADVSVPDGATWIETPNAADGWLKT